MTFNNGPYNEATLYTNPQLNVVSDELVAPSGSLLDAVNRVNPNFFMNAIYPHPCLLKLLASPVSKLTLFLPAVWNAVGDKYATLTYVRSSLVNCNIDQLMRLSPYLLLNTISDTNNVIVYKGDVNYPGNKILYKINCTNGTVYVTRGPISKLY